MAYRFATTADKVEFATSPFTGYVFGPVTFAAFVKRTTVSSGNRPVASFDDSTLATMKQEWIFNSADNPRMLLGGIGGSSGSQVASSTSLWYLVAWTWAGAGNVARIHVHDGTSWTHTAGASLGSNLAALVSGDRLRVGLDGSSGAPTSFAGDIVCCGVKKSNSTDVAVETLSRTAFTAWASFGFEWLIGFDSSFLSGGLLQDQGTVGTGDELSRAGTSVVSDPAGWSFVLASPPVADFSATPLTGTEPLSVAFTDTSTNTPTSWAWTFGDGGTSTSQNPSHSYAADGVYTVSLVATNAGGSDTETKTAYVTVSNPGGSFTKIKWGTGLVVTDEGAGVIRADVSSTETLPASIVDAKGDIIAASAADTVARLAATTNGFVLTLDSAQTLGLKWAAAGTGRSVRRVLATSGPGATPTVNTDSYDVVHLTALAAAITSMTTNLTGTPVDGDTLRISFTDNGTARAIAWGASFEASTVALPTTTVLSTRLDVGLFWNTETSKWRCVAAV